MGTLINTAIDCKGQLGLFDDILRINWVELARDQQQCNDIEMCDNMNDIIMSTKNAPVLLHQICY